MVLRLTSRRSLVKPHNQIHTKCWVIKHPPCFLGDSLQKPNEGAPISQENPLSCSGLMKMRTIWSNMDFLRSRAEELKVARASGTD